MTKRPDAEAWRSWQRRLPPRESSSGLVAGGSWGSSLRATLSLVLEISFVALFALAAAMRPRSVSGVGSSAR